MSCRIEEIIFFIKLKTNQFSAPKMLSNDEIGYILSFIEWKDLIYYGININIQFRQESIKLLQRLKNIFICCNSDDFFCIQFLNSHNIKLKRLTKVVYR